MEQAGQGGPMVDAGRVAGDEPARVRDGLQADAAGLVAVPLLLEQLGVGHQGLGVSLLAPRIALRFRDDLGRQAQALVDQQLAIGPQLFAHHLVLVREHDGVDGAEGPVARPLGPVARVAGRGLRPGGADRQRRADDRARDEQDEDRGGQPGHPRVAAGPSPGSPDRPHRPGRNRLAVEIPAEVVGQVQCAAVSLGGILLQALEADRLQVARHVRPEEVRGDGLGVDDQLQCLQGRLAQERRPAGERLVQYRSQGINVGRRADVLRAPWACSGAMYLGVPIGCPEIVRPESEPSSFARPKSLTLGIPPPVRAPKIWQGSGGRGSVRAAFFQARTEPRSPGHLVVIGTLKRILLGLSA